MVGRKNRKKKTTYLVFNTEYALFAGDPVRFDFHAELCLGAIAADFDW